MSRKKPISEYRCACSQPATKMKNGDPCCDRCAGMEDKRYNKKVSGLKFKTRHLVT